ncbi:HAD-IA family hydrolase [Dyadobacter fermentans]|uniref:HAD-superfamily hydrolase, subfamily IA, variant 1 n=1 Tax=Dyadobacter fermentans (strain ATCC 700827 / DSM 18053 / CIP 107007 / KCTC 52180 / NS114) TaxID=471854 RepID=C6W6H0_DYAFD|nr:HAD-IA family hydrolase [Dyadobacter fermentans]ACT94310.1 HAD-superfamily hydrolase, subfamily IA, variant 1 [Dyadobacter fermentans DSM 18053]
MPIELVVFDMAGTTVRDRNFVGIAFQQAMRSQGYDIAIENVNPLMGYEKPLAIKMMLEVREPDKSKITESLVDSIHTHFVNGMIDFYKTTDEIAPLPNVEETFAALRAEGVKIALNTGFSRNIADVIVDRLGWADRIDCLVASDEVPYGRPYPDMIRKIMAALGVTPAENVAKVGDTEVDINEGINAGCKYVIGVTTGAFTREQLLPYKPTHVIDDIAEVPGIILASHEMAVKS